MFCPLRGAKNRCQLMGYSGMNSIFWRPCTLSFQHFRTERWSVIERPTDSTTGTTSGQTDTTSVQTSTTSGRKCTTNGQTNRQATTMSEKWVLEWINKYYEWINEYYEWINEYYKWSSEYYEWPDEFCKYYERQDGVCKNYYPELMSSLM